ncbi:Dioxygenase swnH1 [Colletotrichum trifolii]|uniref:Dioxygenase swnH1 n=1 Tax=Colletotrichum trifolii TaxID=5466 RepID=A0A4R8RTN5_COLTR|nr:Dioxygenase swnH1 [Colletotrichum trifolii]
MRIGPGGKAQPLHRDDYISHNYHEAIDKWDDERDKNRETAVGLFVAGSRITKENGGTQFIPRSHLWYFSLPSPDEDAWKDTYGFQPGTKGLSGSDREQPPSVDECIFADMDKGDAFIMLASAFHAGGHNTTKDEKRLMFATFSIRGYLRQEENQFLAVPHEKAKTYDERIQRFMGYELSEPACGWVEEMDPIFVLRPELNKDRRPTDF